MGRRAEDDSQARLQASGLGLSALVLLVMIRSTAAMED
jgi:hypothetical protein